MFAGKLKRMCWARTSLFIAAIMLVGFGTAGCSSITEEEVAAIAKAIAVEKGSRVADVGAGDGVLLPYLASWVGPDGLVFGTELDPEKVAALSELALELELQQVEAVQGTPTRTGLDTLCCDAIVTRMVYHHFTDPSAFIDSLHRSLKPGGRLLIVDFKPSVWMSSSAPDGLPEDREGQHGVSPELVIKEVTEKGFILKRQFDDWSGPGGVVLNHFAVLFARSEAYADG